MLAIAVFYIGIAIIPVTPKAKQRQWKKPILTHDHKVSEKPCYGLDHSNLPICHADKTFVDQSIILGVSWLSFHNLTLSLLISKGNSWYLRNDIENQYETMSLCRAVNIDQVSSKVNAEDGDNAQRQWDGDHNEEEIGRYLRNIGS